MIVNHYKATKRFGYIGVDDDEHFLRS
jgi:hypothetical protein